MPGVWYGYPRSGEDEFFVDALQHYQLISGEMSLILTEWIGIKVGTDIHCSERMEPNGFGDPLTLVPSAVSHFGFRVKCLHFLQCLHLVQTCMDPTGHGTLSSTLVSEHIHAKLMTFLSAPAILMLLLMSKY